MTDVGTSQGACPAGSCDVPGALSEAQRLCIHSFYALCSTPPSRVVEIRKEATGKGLQSEQETASREAQGIESRDEANIHDAAQQPSPDEGR